ncbi:MAG: hypothetical protein IRZ21_12570 [Thermoleophilaceae bacterium]|nr:hypothetical protein [Thermoleophilaceae bacterium]
MLRGLRQRTLSLIERTAEGSTPPAGVEPRAPGERPRPSARERGVVRRRLREARREREALVLELGELTLAAARGEPDTGRAEQVTKALRSLEEEACALADALATDRTLGELLSTETVAACARCRALVPRHAGYCQRCGEPTGRTPRSVPTPPAADTASESPTGATSAAPAPRSGQ